MHQQAAAVDTDVAAAALLHSLETTVATLLRQFNAFLQRYEDDRAVQRKILAKLTQKGPISEDHSWTTDGLVRSGESLREQSLPAADRGSEVHADNDGGASGDYGSQSGSETESEVGQFEGGEGLQEVILFGGTIEHRMVVEDLQQPPDTVVEWRRSWSTREYVRYSHHELVARRTDSELLCRLQDYYQWLSKVSCPLRRCLLASVLSLGNNFDDVNTDVVGHELDRDPCGDCGRGSDTNTEAGDPTGEELANVTALPVPTVEKGPFEAMTPIAVAERSEQNRPLLVGEHEECIAVRVRSRGRRGATVRSPTVELSGRCSYSNSEVAVSSARQSPLTEDSGSSTLCVVSGWQERAPPAKR